EDYDRRDPDPPAAQGRGGERPQRRRSGKASSLSLFSLRNITAM
ncbi:MAG: hypothetical protein AVDCRST_MAG14-1479, partial [uncultured Rubrobacteraceae bacterium]